MNAARHSVAIVVLTAALLGCGKRDSPQKTTALKVSVGQSAADFVRINDGAKSFQSPIHPAADGFLIFHELESITLIGAGITAPIKIPAHGGHGSAVVSFDTYEIERDRTKPESLESVAYRPAHSVNSPQMTQAVIHEIVGILNANPECTGGEYEGPAAIDFGKASSFSSEALQPFLQTYLAASKIYICGDMIVTFQVSTSNLNFSVAADNPGFDIHLFINTKKAHERRLNLFNRVSPPQHSIQPDRPASGGSAG